MRTTMDAAGRIRIPKEIRRLAGWQPDTALEVRWSDGRIEVEPAPAQVTLVERGRFLVATVEANIEPLTAATVEATREELAASAVERTLGERANDG